VFVQLTAAMNIPAKTKTHSHGFRTPPHPIDRG
jgi:hypothetical protein